LCRWLEDMTRTDVLAERTHGLSNREVVAGVVGLLPPRVSVRVPPM
jgi:hypothetical protein